MLPVLECWLLVHIRNYISYFLVVLTLLPSAYTSINCVPIPMQVAVWGRKTFHTFTVWYHSPNRRIMKPVDRKYKNPGHLFLQYGWKCGPEMAFLNFKNILQLFHKTYNIDRAVWRKVCTCPINWLKNSKVIIGVGDAVLGMLILPTLSIRHLSKRSISLLESRSSPMQSDSVTELSSSTKERTSSTVIAHVCHSCMHIYFLQIHCVWWLGLIHSYQIGMVTFTWHKYLEWRTN